MCYCSIFYLWCFGLFFFFKQKTAYEMRISDWSSDVCSSDLAMESGRANPWGIEELGERYQGMLQRIIGFRAKVTSLSGKFKLGQDESPETRASTLTSLSDAETVAWMRRFNEGRGNDAK